MERFLVALQQIDWIKNVIQFFIYFFVIIVIFFAILKPKLDEYKEANIEYRKAEILYKQNEALAKSKTDEVKRLRSENNSILTAFKNRYKKDEIEKILGGYFMEFNILESTQSISREGFDRNRLKIDSILKNSQNYYDFLLGLNSSGYIIENDFPILFDASDRGIKSSFYLNIYNID